jgi:hypothetical protein
MIVENVPFLQDEGRTTLCETLGAMWIFLILVKVLCSCRTRLFIFFVTGDKERFITTTVPVPRPQRKPAKA